MLGTIVNTTAIIVGAVIGSYLKRGIKPQYQQALFNAMGLCSLALGFNAFCQNMPKSNYPVLFIVSLALGSLVGFMLRLDERFKRLVDRKKALPSPSLQGGSSISSNGETSEQGNHPLPVGRVRGGSTLCRLSIEWNVQSRARNDVSHFRPTPLHHDRTNLMRTS